MILDNIRELNDRITISPAPDGLSAIRRPDCAATVWQRHPLPSFQRWINALPPDQLPKAVCDALIDIACQRGTPDCAERNLLIEDATALAAIFANIMGSAYLRLRFDVINTNACRKFHIDAVTVRLICTYRGTGTQYGLSENGHDPEQIVTVPTGSPVILRGTRRPETSISGLLHRSPPIAGKGETRLLLVLDPIEDPEREVEATYIH